MIPEVDILDSYHSYTAAAQSYLLIFLNHFILNQHLNSSKQKME